MVSLKFKLISKISILPFFQFEGLSQTPYDLGLWRQKFIKELKSETVNFSTTAGDGPSNVQY